REAGRDRLRIGGGPGGGGASASSARRGGGGHLPGSSTVKFRRVMYRLRRTLTGGAGLGALGLLAVLDARSFFADIRLGAVDFWQIVALALLVGLLVSRLAGRIVLPVATRPTLRDHLRDLEFGLTLVVSTWAILGMTGGARSPVYPLVYVLVAYLVAFHRLAVGIPLVAAMVSLELATNSDAAAEMGHIAFIVLFALVNLVFLHAEVWRSRRESRDRIDREIRSMRDEARDF